MKAIQKIADMFQYDIVKINGDDTPPRVNKNQQKVFSPASVPRVPKNILDHSIKTSNIIPYDEHEIDTKIHNHQYPIRFSLSRKRILAYRNHKNLK